MYFRKHKGFSSFFSLLLALSYLFVFLFSTRLHHHQSSDFLKFPTEKNLNKTKSHVQTSYDCMMCHFFAHGYSVESDLLKLEINKFSQKVFLLIKHQEKIWSQIKFSFHLRGPPYFIF